MQHALLSLQRKNHGQSGWLVLLIALLAWLPLLVVAQSGLTGTTVAGGNGPGPAANQLVPQGIFVDGTGNLFVADQNNHRVQKFAPGSTTGVTVAGGNGRGSAANQLDAPRFIFVDGTGNLFVADQNNHRVQKFAPGSTTGVTVAGGNGRGSAANQVNFPAGIFVDGAGNLYVAEVGNANPRIQKFAPGSTNGVTVAGGNGVGSAANQLYAPQGIFVDGTGNLFVVDYFNYRVQKFAPGSINGLTVAGGNGQGSAANQLNAPFGIFVDGSGNVFVAEQLNNRIQKFAPGSTTGVTVAGGNGGGSAANQLSFPYDVFVDASGNLLVSDTQNTRVQKFAPITISTQPEGGSVCAGGDFSTSVAASSNATLSYQWFKGNAPLVPAQNTPTLSLTNVQPADAGSYSVLISNEISTLRSNAIVLSVNPLPTASIDSNDPICSGADAIFSVSGTDGATLTYTITGQAGNQTLPLNGSNQTITSPSATSEVTLMLVSVTKDNCQNALSETATVTINPPPTASIVTNNTAICAGSDASFTVSGTDGATLTYTITGQTVNQTLALNGSSQTITTSNATSDVTLTLVSVTKDNCEETLSETSTVTVNQLPIVDAGPDKFVYLGYGSTCTDLMATAMGTPTLSYAWDMGAGNGATVNVCPEATTIYTVTVTDGKGCQATAQVTVTVQDVRCGNNNDKVLVCHNGKELCISVDGVADHLAHGDVLGGCGNSASRIGYETETTRLPLQLTLKAYPNPVQNAVTVEVLSPSAGTANFEVLDVAGLVRQSRTENLIEGLNEVKFRLGTLPTGIYLIRATDALNRQGVVRVSKE